MSEDEFYRIEKYLLNEMTEEEESLFESELATQQRLKTNLKEVQELILSIRNVSRSQLMDSLETVEINSAQPRFYSVLKIAASVLLITVAGYLINLFINDYRNDRIASNYYSPLKTLPLDLSESNSEVIEVKTDALKEYQAGNYKRVIELSTTEEEHKDSDLHMLRGLSYMELDEVRPAIREFRSVIEINNRHVIESKWYLSLCLLKVNKKDESIELLESLAGSKNKLYRSDANLVLKDLGVGKLK
jgi:tetratricopeptide (TPR) repeat protein